MPLCGCHSASTFSESLVVPVPADVLWATVVDLPALPSVVSMVTAFEWVSSRKNSSSSSRCEEEDSKQGNSNNNNNNNRDTPPPPSPRLRVGDRFREVRRHKGQDIVMYKTVTRLSSESSDDNDKTATERYLSFGIGMKHAETGQDFSKVENTSTLIVQDLSSSSSSLEHEDASSSSSSSSSLLILTVAFAGWSNWMDYLVNYCLCRLCINRMVRHFMQQEVQDYKQAAMQRYQKVQQQQTSHKES